MEAASRGRCTIAVLNSVIWEGISKKISRGQLIASAHPRHSCSAPSRLPPCWSVGRLAQPYLVGVAERTAVGVVDDSDRVGGHCPRGDDGTAVMLSATTTAVRCETVQSMEFVNPRLQAAFPAFFLCHNLRFRDTRSYLEWPPGMLRSQGSG